MSKKMKLTLNAVARNYYVYTAVVEVPDDFDAMDCDCKTLFHEVDAVLYLNEEGDYGDWDFLDGDLQETDADAEARHHLTRNESGEWTLNSLS